MSERVLMVDSWVEWTDFRPLRARPFDAPVWPAIAEAEDRVLSLAIVGGPMFPGAPLRALEKGLLVPGDMGFWLLRAGARYDLKPISTGKDYGALDVCSQLLRVGAISMDAGWGQQAQRFEHLIQNGAGDPQSWAFALAFAAASGLSPSATFVSSPDAQGGR